MDMDQYLDVFIEEAKEHLQAINNYLIDFEKDPENKDIVNHIFRSAHTLKGMAATMEFEDLASLTHEMENVLDLIRNQKLQVNTHIIDVIFESVDALEGMVVSIIEGGDGKQDVTTIVKQLAAIVSGDVLEEMEPVQVKAVDALDSRIEEDQIKPAQNRLQINDYELTVLSQSIEVGYNVYYIQVTLRSDCILKAARAYMVFDLLEKTGEIIKSVPSVEDIESENFDTSFELVFISESFEEHIKQIILKVSEIEDVLVEKLQIDQRKMIGQSVDPEGTTQEDFSDNDGDSEESQIKKNKQMSSKTIRVNIERLDALMNLFSELVIDRGRLEQLSNEINHSELDETLEHMSRISSDLQDLILNMRMVPIEQVFNRFPRMVRGLAKELNKAVDLQISGMHTELDRTVIDEIGDPLVHLLRNAIDHGIETPEERRNAGKRGEGVIQLNAYHSGNHVFIDIMDDGNGIERNKIMQMAIKNNVISKEQANKMNDAEAYQLLFASGFTTAEEVSDVSGRGVGLDVVRNKIEAMGGVVSVDSEEGKGSKFSIQLPLTLSIISCMLVNVGEGKYAVPLSSIIETAVYNKSDVRSVHGQRVIDYRGRVVPLMSLKNIFEESSDEEDEEFVSVLIVRKGKKSAALIVDSFIGQQEIVLKSLGNYLVNVFAISGATILGDGQVALIVDCNALLR